METSQKKRRQKKWGMEAGVERKIEEERKRRDERDRAKKKKERIRKRNVQKCSPGPGAYYIERADPLVFESLHQAPFSPIMHEGHCRECSKREQGLGPAQYHPETGDRVTRPCSPNTFIGSSERSDLQHLFMGKDYSVPSMESPGPGHYVNLDPLPNSGLGWTSPRKKDSLSEQVSTPGPGHYSWEHVQPAKKLTSLPKASKESLSKQFMGNQFSSVPTESNGEYVSAYSTLTHPLYKGTSCSIAGRNEMDPVERPEIHRSGKIRRSKREEPYAWLAKAAGRSIPESRATKVIGYGFSQQKSRRCADGKSGTPGPKYMVKDWNDFGRHAKGPSFPKAKRTSPMDPLEVTREKESLRCEDEVMHRERQGMGQGVTEELFKRLDPLEELVYM